MIDRWIASSLRRATPLRLGVALALLTLYAGWIFLMDSPLTRALGDQPRSLPELMFGFPDKEPGTALQNLGGAQPDYFWLQAFDIPFFALVFLTAMLAISLALRKFRLDFGDTQYLLLAPAVYFICEVIENSMLALLSSGAIAASGAIALLQQLATTAKFASLLVTLTLALVALAGLAINALRRRPAMAI